MSVDNDPPGRWDGRCASTWTNGNRCENGTGHEGGHYQPMPGDLVSIDCQGIPTKYDQHGYRLGTVTRVSGAHGTDVVFVQLPGWGHTLCVDPGWMELVRRAA